LAKPLKEICDAHDVAFVVNDDVVLAKELGASGLHLGQGDMPLKQARAELGDQIQIGITCHDSRHMAMEAGEGGANYVAFGAFFATQTKETSHRPDPDILRWWSTMMEIPCVAIGGITPENCRPLVEAGADFLAVSGAVWNDPKGSGNAVREFHAQLDNA
jgi:thiamine-phosphate pyrophosphorylase